MQPCMITAIMKISELVQICNFWIAAISASAGCL